MASSTHNSTFLHVFVLSYLCCTASQFAVRYVGATDADPLQDFCVADVGSAITVNGLTCKPAAQVQSSDFKSVLLQNASTLDADLGVAINLVTASRFPALNTQGLSIARIDFQPKGINPPHVHPRASEVFFLAEGTLLAGFVTATPGNNTLFQQKLSAGDVFIFPRGLAHFQFNPDKTKSALAIAAFNSQNPGRTPACPSLLPPSWSPSSCCPRQKSHRKRQDSGLKINFDVDDAEVESLIASITETLV